MIYRLREMIPPSDVQTQTLEGFWVASYPCPFYDGLIGRARAAWSVLKGEAMAFSPPVNGEFEMAIAEKGWKLSRDSKSEARR